MDEFLEISEILTGFSRADLEATGLPSVYYNEVREIVGERMLGSLLAQSRGLSVVTEDRARAIRNMLSNELIGPIAKNILLLWYTGTWYEMPCKWRTRYGASADDLTHVVSPEAYREGLIWRVIGAHPPSAKPPGFGTWTKPLTGQPDIRDEWFNMGDVED